MRGVFLQFTGIYCYRRLKSIPKSPDKSYQLHFKKHQSHRARNKIFAILYNVLLANLMVNHLSLLFFDSLILPV